MNAPAYLYLIESIGAPVAKVGVTVRPRERILDFRAGSPFDLRYRCVLRLPSMGQALANEAHILKLANRHAARGEWVRLDETLDALFAAVEFSEDATAVYAGTVEGGREIPTTDTLAIIDYANAKVANRGVPVKRRFWAGIITDALDEGLGCDDVFVRYGIPRDAYWQVVADRRSGRVAAQ